MYVENANFIRSVEVDDSIFQCDPQCDKTYFLKLERDTDNAQWLWKVKEYSGEGGTSSLSDLTDVAVGAVTDWQVLAYDSATGKWVNKVDEWSDTFAGLTDVDITGLQNGDVAVYNSTTNKREPQQINADTTLSESITTNVEVGWIPVGTTFTAGTSLESIVRQMLVKYFAPTIALTINPSTSPVISGTTIASVTMSAVATKKTDNITSIGFYANNTLVHEVTTGVASGGTFTYTYTPTDPIDDDITFKVTVSDGTSDVDATKKIDFVSGSYFGQVADTVTNPTASDITALTQLALAAKGYTANNISMIYGKLLYAYPASYGDLTSIKDGNNFEYINSYTKSTVNVNGVSYNCYLMTDATGVTGFKQIYA